MRQWARVVALVLGLAGNGYVWTAQPRIPTPIERPLVPARAGRRAVQTLDWWQR
jgi:hypothetical protein